MPTTPNPTPPISEPATGQPEPTTPPVNNTLPPELPNSGYRRTRSQVGYTDVIMASQFRKSVYVNDSPVSGVPGPVIFTGICPGYWSRRYLSMQDAAALTGGSGYFGYPASGTTSSSGYWSTNFVDDGVYASKFVFSEGSYYSKNVVLNKGKVLLGVVAFDGDDIVLKWGGSWGIASRNSMMDYQVTNDDGSTSLSYRGFIVPRWPDGTLNVDELNKMVLKGAPTRGAFVQLNLDYSSVTYLCTDGEENMYPLGAQQQVTIQSRDATDPSSLPLTSKLNGLPTFTTGSFTMRVVTGRPTYYQRFLTAKPQRTSKWLKFNPAGTSMDWGGDNVASDDPNQVHAQSYSNAAVLVGYRGAFITKGTDGPLRSINLADPVDVYGSWLAVGASTQCVGWIGNGSYIGISNWGLTSLSPAASVNGSASFDPITSDVQNEILDNIPGSAEIGFIYDATIGDFGRVFWISML